MSAKHKSGDNDGDTVCDREHEKIDHRIRRRSKAPPGLIALNGEKRESPNKPESQPDAYNECGPRKREPRRDSPCQRQSSGGQYTAHVQVCTAHIWLPRRLTEGFVRQSSADHEPDWEPRHGGNTIGNLLALLRTMQSQRRPCV